MNLLLKSVKISDCYFGDFTQTARDYEGYELLLQRNSSTLFDHGYGFGTRMAITLISVDSVVLRLNEGRLQVLTAPTPHCRDGQLYALPAGRIDMGRDHNLEQTARRHIRALTRATPSWLEQVETIGNDTRDSRGWSLTVVYFALLRNEPGTDLPNALWHDIRPGQELPELAYDHQMLVKAAIERLCNKIQYTTLPIYFLPESFTLSDIRDVFVSLLGKAPPMRSIRNRFNEECVLEPTGEKRHGSNRPANLYRIRGGGGASRLFSRLYESTQ